MVEPAQDIEALAELIVEISQDPRRAARRIRHLEAEVAKLEEEKRLARAERFAASAERNDHQVRLFDEAEQTALTVAAVDAESVFEPIEFLARLAALVPRPRGNLVRYHGILAPNAKHRSAVVPSSSRRTRRRRAAGHAGVQVPGGDRQADPDAPTAPMTWMERLRRVFAIDLSICPHCGGRLRVIADVTRPDIIQKILEHVARQQAPPEFSARR